MRLYRQNSSGISLLELMLVLVVIAAILLFAVRYYSQASRNFKVSQSVKIVNTIIDASYKWVEGEKNFSDLTDINILVNLGLLPQEYTVSPYSGAIQVQGVDNDQIRITIDNVPVNACNSMNDILEAQNVQPAECKGNYSAIYPNKEE